MANYKVEVNNLFSSTVWQESLDLDTDELSKECLRRKELDKEGAVKSNQGGWQSKRIESLDSFLPLIERITSSANAFADHLSLKELKLSNIWININGYKDYNFLHDHPSAVISGVYYVKVPENGGNIEFYHPHLPAVTRDWADALKDYKMNNSPVWWYTSSDNMLFLFPSWLQHQVQPNMSHEDRISISFNFDVK